MLVNTSRFGSLDVADERVITFAHGILGFPAQKHYALLQPRRDGCFRWLQATDRPDLAFAVTDPTLFVSSYRVPIKPDQMTDLGLMDVNDAQVLVIVNKRGRMLTGNLQGPLVLNPVDRLGAQLVLSDRRFTTRVPLMELPAPAEAVPA